MILNTYILYLKQKVEILQSKFFRTREGEFQKTIKQEIPNEAFFSIKDKFMRFWRKWATTCSFFIALSAGLAEVTGYSLKDLFCEEKTFSISVVVHGEEGKGHAILRNDGSVFLDVGDIRLEAHIDHRGVATFEEVPSAYKKKAAYLGINHSSYCNAIEEDKGYPLNGGKNIYLQGKLRSKESHHSLVDF